MFVGYTLHKPGGKNVLATMVFDDSADKLKVIVGNVKSATIRGKGVKPVGKIPSGKLIHVVADFRTDQRKFYVLRTDKPLGPDETAPSPALEPTAALPQVTSDSVPQLGGRISRWRILMRAIWEVVQQGHPLTKSAVMSIVESWGQDWRSSDGTYHNENARICKQKKFLEFDRRGNWTLTQVGRSFCEENF